MTTFTQEKQQTSTHDHDVNARTYIQAMLTGKKPTEMPEVGKWTYCCKLLSDTYDDAPESIEVTLNSLIKSKKIPGLKELMSDQKKTSTPDSRARAYIKSLLTHDPIEMGNVGKWTQCCLNLEAQYEGNPEAIQLVLDTLIATKAYPGLKELLLDDQPIHPLQESERVIPILPENVKANEAGAELASPTLDELIAYFKYWATRSYEGYHEAVAIWVLATIAARRVVLPWRGGMWTTLYIMLVSKSGRHAKTEAASYGSKIIRDCGLGFLLAPDETTPQRLLSKMSGKTIPRNYSCMTEQEKETLCLKLAFSAQKGWQYDEFGDFLEEVIQSRGYNTQFYRLLKQLYDNKPEFTYDTGMRGEEHIDFPSLSIIGTTAPESLASVAKKESKVWTDGAFARIAFIVPPPESIKLQSAPDGKADVPRNIIQKLIDWHNRLRIPTCTVIDLEEQEEMMEQAHGKNKKKKKFNGDPYRIDRDPLPQNEIYWNGTGVREAHELYYQALVQVSIDHDLDARLGSNYIRLPDMALKIAMLLASVEGCRKIEMQHWARGQQITERWRANLHELLAQLSSDQISTHNYGDMEDQIIDVLTKRPVGEMINARFISQQSTSLRKLGAPEIRKICDELVETAGIAKDGTGKSTLYGIKKPEK